MKIALMLMSLKTSGNPMVHQVAEWGYKYIAAAPADQPVLQAPARQPEIMAEYKQALRDTGVELSSFICVYRWSGPDELRRQAAVKNWKRLIEIAVEMGVQVINTEFSGDPNQPRFAMNVLSLHGRAAADF
jgi:myo-inositol catabolism protein IolH